MRARSRDDHDGALDEVEIFALLEEGLVHRDEIHHAAPVSDGVIEKFRDASPGCSRWKASRVIEVADRAAAIDAFAQGWPNTT